ncbi:MAG: carboxyl transferase domain-containing protein [Thermodesulfobacteriota bacterium]|nr:carboxyl transferase domain-containing protein [Thermodesulfobacteriota bacterium]
MAFEEIIKELEQKKHKALQMGGPEKVRKQHDKGRLTARERIEKLLDPGSFLEMGLLAHSDMPGMEDSTPADSLICGYGLINKRRVAIIVNDFTVLASTNAKVNLKKLLEFKAQVKDKIQVPLIVLGEAGGARMPDCQGSKEVCGLTGPTLYGLMPEYTHFRKQPLIFAAMGDCYGVADFQANLADFVVQVKGSSISVSGPRALGRAIGETYTGEEMGGWEVHSRITGIADQVAGDEDDCFRIIRKYLEYMPQNNSELPSLVSVPDGSGGKASQVLEVLPESRKRVYDMHKVIECVIDEGSEFELKPEFGKMLITCLARIDGDVVGVVANNPIVNMGATNADALDKLMSFLCLCDSYNIPLVFFHDTPGHMVGKEAETKKVGARVVNALQALFQVTVPKISIIVRKTYGQVTINMCGPGAGPDFIVAWPTAEIGFMDPSIAADVVFGGLSEEERKKSLKRMIGDVSPYPAAGAYYLQDIIDPRDTRDYIIKVLKIVRDSKSRGIGEHRLANWPTKF